MTRALQEAPRQEAQEYYTDSSVSNGNTAVAFACNNSATHYRLRDGTCILQAELMATKGALKHTLQTPVSAVIHTNSLAAIQTLQKNRATDNIGLMTLIWLVTHELQRRDMQAYLNWMLIGIPGNEEADKETKNALLLLATSTLTSTKSKLNNASHEVAMQELR